MDSHLRLIAGEEIGDSEMEELLTEVYVDGGFTDPLDAKSLFKAASVKERGILIGVRDGSSGELAGVVILVPPDSGARRLATKNEAEMHLLGVKERFRCKGVGRFLVQSVLAMAKTKGYSKIVLWTQSTMFSAQNLYSSVGFFVVDKFNKNSRDFIVYNLVVA